MNEFFISLFSSTEGSTRKGAQSAGEESERKTKKNGKTFISEKWKNNSTAGARESFSPFSQCLAVALDSREISTLHKS